MGAVNPQCGNVKLEVYGDAEGGRLVLNDAAVWADIPTTTDADGNFFLNI